jgi:quinol monooxygenase YgiN
MTYSLRSLSGLALGGLLLVSTLSAQGGGPSAPADGTFYAVSYVEAMASAKATAVASLKQYREASRKEDGFIRVDVFEQAGWPAHFVIVEAWRDQKAFDAHAAAAQKSLIDALQSVRASGFDLRPYKTLSVGASPAAPNGRAVSVVSHVDVAPNPQTPVLLKNLAEASRKDEGNVRFDVLQHTMRANHFTVIETWRDQKALDAHVAAAHTRQYRDELQPTTGSPLDERAYKAIE